MSTASASTDWFAGAPGPVEPVTWKTTAITATNAARIVCLETNLATLAVPAVVDTNIDSTTGYAPFHAPNRTERVYRFASGSFRNPASGTSTRRAGASL